MSVLSDHIMAPVSNLQCIRPQRVVVQLSTTATTQLTEVWRRVLCLMSAQILHRNELMGDSSFVLGSPSPL